MRGVVDCGRGYDIVYTGHRKPRTRNSEKLVNRWTTARRDGGVARGILPRHPAAAG
jgi:hypothetical protein